MQGLGEYTTEVLEAELRDRKYKEALIQNMPQIRKIIDYQELLDYLDQSLKVIAKENYVDDDFEHFVFKKVIDVVYGEEFWDWYNKIHY